MQFCIIGLGRMGGNLARRAMEKGHGVVGYNRSPQPTQTVAQEGLEPALTLDELGRKLEAPRIVLIYVPHGEPTDNAIRALKGCLQLGDLVADGGNSHWKDSARHYPLGGVAGERHRVPGYRHEWRPRRSAPRGVLSEIPT